MSELYVPELGQMCFGNPCGACAAGDLGEACLAFVLSEVERVFGNQKQRPWDYDENPRIPGITFRPYYWGDWEEEAAKPNFVVDGFDIEIRWYKHPCRGVTTQRAVTPDEWAAWLSKALELVRAADDDR